MVGHAKRLEKYECVSWKVLIGFQGLFGGGCGGCVWGGGDGSWWFSWKWLNVFVDS